MFTNTYKGVPDFIKDCLESIIDKSDDYHNVNHKRRYARTIQVLLDQQPSGRLLEVGTSKLIPRALKTLAPEVEVFVTDFDLNNPETNVLEIDGDSYSAYSVDIEKTPLPAPDDYFDYVLCCEVLEHMEIDPMFMLSEINRVMKLGGTLILTTPNAVSTHSLTKMLAGIEPYFYMQYHKSGEYHRHNYEYSVHTLVRVLKAAGFDGSIWTEDTFENGIPSIVDKLKSAGFDISNVGDNIMTVSKKQGPVADRYPACIYV
jgi:ubiquinone/menaquinone biosynthesis C-methylase UbiE